MLSEPRRRAVGRLDDDAAPLEAREQGEEQATGRGYAMAAPRLGDRRDPGGKGEVAVEGGHRQRLIRDGGGVGLVKNGTRLAQSFAACQWMRATTPTVNAG